MIIESKAPTRVDFAGSTLDIWPLYLFHPGAVTLNAAISLYASCVIETLPTSDSRIKLVSRDIKSEESFPSFTALVKAKRYRLPLLAEITKFFHPQGGFTLTTDSEAPAGAGIGGSSAMAVAICAALDRFTGAGKSKVDWIHISRDAEAIVINVPTGTQDHYPPAFGGAAAIELPPGGERRGLLHRQAPPARHQQLGSVQSTDRQQPRRAAQSRTNLRSRPANAFSFRKARLAGGRALDA